MSERTITFVLEMLLTTMLRRVTHALHLAHCVRLGTHDCSCLQCAFNSAYAPLSHRSWRRLRLRTQLPGLRLHVLLQVLRLHALIQPL